MKNTTMNQATKAPFSWKSGKIKHFSLEKWKKYDIFVLEKWKKYTKKEDKQLYIIR